MTDEEVRARLQAEAEKAINKVLAERPDADKMTLRDIERLAVQAGEELSAGIQQALGRKAVRATAGRKSSARNVGAECKTVDSTSGKW
jgi:ribosomal 50S subunit-associated protein YjgA (DUF615 family)